MAAPRIAFNDLARLTAAHAALDPTRREWRHDILISSIIEILALKGPLTEHELHLQIKKIWLTDAIDKKLLHAALGLAEEASLIECLQRPSSMKWKATPASVADAKTDHVWAETIIARFERDLGNRLPDLIEGHDVADPTRRRQLTQYLIGALMAGSQPVLKAVIVSRDPENLNGIDFDMSAVHAYLQARVLPEKVATALKALAIVALDPYEDFGTEIVRLIIAGQILQGMLGYRDLAGPSWVDGSMLLLDTSVLVYRLDNNGPQSRLLEELLQISSDVHCNIVVTRAVINEWNRLWQGATSDAQTLAASATDLPHPLIRFARILCYAIGKHEQSEDVQ